jgi:hypothetical protein
VRRSRETCAEFREFGHTEDRIYRATRSLEPICAAIHPKDEIQGTRAETCNLHDLGNPCQVEAAESSPGLDVFKGTDFLTSPVGGLRSLALESMRRLALCERRGPLRLARCREATSPRSLESHGSPAADWRSSGWPSLFGTALPASVLPIAWGFRDAYHGPWLHEVRLKCGRL